MRLKKLIGVEVVNLNVYDTEETIVLQIRGKLNEELLVRVPELLDEYDSSRAWEADLSGASGIDARGTVGLLRLAKGVRNGGGSFRLKEINDLIRQGLELYHYQDFLEKEAPPEPYRGSILEYFGTIWFGFQEACINMVVLIYDTAYWFFVAPFLGKGFDFSALTKQVTRNGLNAIPIISLISFLFGLVLSINGAYLLSYWGQNHLIADMVGIGFTREFAPVLVGVMLAARSGAAIAAEIGTMEVREEVEAMWTMGMNPAKHLTVPRVLSLALIAPVLSLVSNFVGIVGSFFVSVFVFGVNGNTFIRRLHEAIFLRDIVTGLGKSAVFGIVIGFVGCWFGHSVQGNAEEVGDAATRSVVWSIVLIIVADGIFSTLFYFFDI